jgi:iron(III) transport system substrate-binding protein
MFESLRYVFAMRTNGPLRPNNNHAGEGRLKPRAEVALASIIATAFILLAPGAGRAQDTAQSLYEAARREGKVVIWTALDVSLHKKVAAKFNAKYPDIAVEAFKIFPGPAIERLITEAKGGRINVDIIDPNIAFLPLLFDRGFAEPYPYDKVFGIDPARLLFDRRAIAIGHYDIPIAYNTAAVAADAIKSYDDLLDPKYRGKLLLEAHAYGFAILAVKWGEERTLDFIKRLLTQRPTIINSPTATAEGLASGQGSVAFGAYAARISLFKDAGAPVDWARVGPIPAQTVVSVPIKGGPHPAAAKLYAAFWATPDAQRIFYEEQRHGMLTGQDADPRAEDIKQRGLEVIFEPTDIEQDRHLLEVMGRALGGK